MVVENRSPAQMSYRLASDLAKSRCDTGRCRNPSPAAREATERRDANANSPDRAHRNSTRAITGLRQDRGEGNSPGTRQRRRIRNVPEPALEASRGPFSKGFRELAGPWSVAPNWS